jgi:polyhydroxybutyrate depolymerase
VIPLRDVCRPLLFGALLAALLGCGHSRDERVVEPRTGRSYRVIVPPGDDAPRPVLFALHAYATKPDVLVDAYQLVLLSRMAGFVLVVPEGRLDALGNPHWNASAACCGRGARHDDLGYLEAVLDDAAKRTAIDRERVAAIGVSNGAFMAQRWACAERADLAALVSVSGAFAGPDDPKCINAGPVSVLHVHGTEDQVVRFDGGDFDGRRYPSVEQTIAAWRAHDRCAVAPERSRSFTPTLERIDISTYRGPQATVRLWRIEGGSHNMPALRLFAWKMVSFLRDAMPHS